MSSEIDILPEGWQKTTLEHLIIRISNGVNVTQYKEKIGLPITRIETIWNGTIDLNRVKYIKEDSDELRLKYGLRHGDILFSHINSDSHLGKTAIFRSQVKCLIHGTNLLLIRPSAEISSEHLNYQIQFLRQKGEFVAVAQRAVNQSSINQRKLKAFEFLLPPLNEQRRIVAKIEELFSELDKGIENLKAARAKLNIYRQAVLKHAFEGKLTKQWREENKDKLETPEQLLTRIKQEREARYERQLTEWKVAVKEWEEGGKSGKKPAKPKKPLDLAGVPQEVIAKLPHLPEGWGWTLLGNISDVSGGLTKNQTRTKLPRKMKYLRVANVYADKIITDDIYEIGVTDSEAKAVALKVGDLLVVEGNGSIDQIGRVAMWDGKLPVCGHQNHLIRVRLATKLNSRFHLQFLLSPLGRDLIVKEANSTSGLHTLSISKVSNLIVPVASLAEASAAVVQIEEKLSRIDKTLEDIDAQLARSKALRQSILKKAFNGQLVPQDPNDEPASVLLDRIRAEREQVAKNNHSKKTKKRKTTA